MNRLRKEYHKKVAYAQDLLVIEVYNVIPDTVLHGGTIIWRCYGGNRFSEDIDAIIPVKYRYISKMDQLKTRLSRLGFEVHKLRVKERSLYARLTYSNTEVRLEAVFRDVGRFISKPYEMVDGTFIYVNTLSPEEILVEKVEAYLSRRRIRDLYDIYIILRHIMDVDKVKESLGKLLEEYEKPIDEEELKLLVLWGVPPSTEDIIREVKRWVRKNI